MSQNPLRKKLQSDQTTLGLWATMECASITEIAVALNIDWVVVDMEHGHLDYKDAMDHIRVVRETGTSIIIRVPDIREDCVKKALDMGAHGVILPLARSADDVERGFQFGRYAPRGVRGIGGERAVKWGLGFKDYLEVANEETMIIPMIETREAGEDIDNILKVEGLEAIFLGPADMSATYGHLGEWEGGDTAELNLEIREKAAAKGIATGVVGTSLENAKERQEQGFKMVALGSDAGLLIRSIQETLVALGRDAKPHLWF
jgi:2-keto-3-deoxy-L-rhamnonate aldolase RhmA